MLKKILRKNIILYSLKRVLDLLPWPYKRKAIKMFILLFLNSILELFGLAAFLPLFTVILQEDIIQTNPFISKIYNTLGFPSENAFILATAGFVVLAIIIKNGSGLLILRQQAKFSLGLYKFFGLKLHRYYYQKGFAFFKQTNSNVIMRDVNAVPQRFANAMVLPLFNLLNEVTILVFILVSLFLYDWRSVLLLLTTILPVFILFYGYVRERSARIEKETNRITPKLGNSIFQSIFGYTDVQITNTQNYFRQKIDYYLAKIIGLSTKRVVYQQAPTRVIETGMVVAIFALIVYGLFFLPSRAALSALLGLFALSAYRILPSVNRIMLALINIKGHQYTFDIISQVKGLKIEEKEQQPLTYNNQIRLNELSFRFHDDNSNVLNNINLTIKRGESIGIIGPSGSGKTTLMNLMLGFWQPTQGDLFLDKQKLNGHTLEAWRDLVGYVQQEVYIIDGSIAENVAFGIPKNEIDENKLTQVIKDARLSEVVKTLPNGIHTRIGERGARFSGGQRQRIGIARALYSDAKILFFDEATSALDNETEQEITEAIHHLKKKDLTIIIVAHRITTLKFCDRIIEIKNGEITREYQYKTLLKEKIYEQ